MTDCTRDIKSRYYAMVAEIGIQEDTTRVKILRDQFNGSLKKVFVRADEQVCLCDVWKL